ncbi:hypothetical protein FRC03_005324 [Tulasnella sp. 419]|nr:hypothetical protein FRC03_005324 [Tulasnella sp. 419]
MTRPYSQRDTDPDGYPHDYPPQIPSPVIPEHPSDYPRPLQQPTISQPHPQAPMVSFPQAEVDSQPANHEAVGRTFESPNHYQSQTMASSSNLRGRDEEEMPWRHPSADRNSTFDNRLSSNSTVTSHAHPMFSSVGRNSTGTFAPNPHLFPTPSIPPNPPANADAGTRDMISSSYRPGPNSYFPASPQSHLADPMGVGSSGRMFETAVIESHAEETTEMYVLRTHQGGNMREDVVTESSKRSGHHRKNSSNNRRIRVGTRMPTMSTDHSYPPSSPPPMTAATSSGFSVNDATQFSYIPSSPHKRGDQGSTSGSIETDFQLREAIVRVIGTDGGNYTYQDHQAIPPEAKKHSPLATGSTDVMGQHHHEGPAVGVESNYNALKSLNQHLAVHPSFTPDNGHSDMSHGETATSSFNSKSPTFDMGPTKSRAGPCEDPFPLHGIPRNPQGDNTDRPPSPGNEKECIFC